jgi:phosphotriesterase-related protein
VVGPRSEGVDPDEVAGLFARDIEVGIADTGIKAGVIKVGTDPIVDDMNDRVLRAAARAHVQTGAPISTHTNAANKVGLTQQDIFEEEGVDLTQVVIGHSGDSPDLAYLKALVERGSFIGMDRFGYTMPGPLGETLSIEKRVEVIAKMCELGYGSKMVLSHDAVCWGDVFSDAFKQKQLPDWNLTYVPNTILDMLRAAGVGDADMEAMTVGNPRAVFAAGKSY